MKRRVKRHAVVQPLDRSYRLIPLTQNQNALVDSGDFDWLSQWNWTLQASRSSRTSYAYRKEGKRTVYMHCVILGMTGKSEVDHRDQDGLNNGRSNLRPSTHGQNTCNVEKRRSARKFKGVWCDHGKWRFCVRFNGHQIYQGGYGSAEEAAIGYNEAAQKLHGEFARLNEV
jgi:hypothetical protein